MSEIITAGEYASMIGLPKNPHLYAWTVNPKKKTLVRKELVKKNQKSTWAKQGVGGESVYSGDLLKQIYEDTEKQLAPYRMKDQEDFKQAERRMGKRILHTEFVKKVLSLNKNLIYEDSVSVKDSGAFYFWRNGLKGPEKIYTGACFRKGWMPEWTIVKTDAADLPTQDGLTYGWRVPLQRLIEQKIITYSQVVATFGDVVRTDLCGKNWNAYAGEFRN